MLLSLIEDMVLYTLRVLTAILIVSLMTACRQEQPRPSITIGAAANLAEVFPEIGRQFETETGIHPVFSFASTAQLARQIENSAPFDVLAAADSHACRRTGTQRTHRTRQPRHLRPRSSGFVDSRRQPGAQVNRVEDLVQPDVHIIAMAKPDLAPYGQAAVETLQRLRIWTRVQPKIVYGENISMAKQYGKSNNADAVFTAYSLVLHEGGKIIRVDERLHQPIDQELGIVEQLIP